MPKAVRSGAARAQSWESAIVENNHYLPRETHDRVAFGRALDVTE